MKNNNNGRRLEKRPSVLGRWMEEYRTWVAGMTRGQKIRHRILQGATLVAALIILVWIVFTVGFQTPKLPGINPGNIGASGSIAPEDWDIEGPDIAKSGRKEGIYTFLVAGLDVASGATDTMLLLSYDVNEKMVHGLNLPRDTIMNVSYNSKRLNTIYTINKGNDKDTQVEKGMAALKKHVAKLTGITADYYILLEWEAIGELVDAIGGVEFEVPFDMHYDDPYQDLHIHQEAGLRLLNGNDAMQVIRHRKNNDGSHSAGDVGRLSIQQDFMKAVVKKCMQPSIFFKIPALADIFTKNVNTDLSVGNILAFAKSAYGMDPETGVSFQTAPLAADAKYKGAAMVALSGKGILEIVNNGMNPYLRDIELGDLELIYKKADGSFGVTNGALADPKMGGVKKPATTKPVMPEKDPEPEVEQPGNAQEQPGGSQEQPGGSQVQPGGSQEQPGGSQEQPGGSQEQPDSSQKPEGGSESQKPEQDGEEKPGENSGNGSNVKPEVPTDPSSDNHQGETSLSQNAEIISEEPSEKERSTVKQEEPESSTDTSSDDSQDGSRTEQGMEGIAEDIPAEEASPEN